RFRSSADASRGPKRLRSQRGPARWHARCKAGQVVPDGEPTSRVVSARRCVCHGVIGTIPHVDAAGRSHRMTFDKEAFEEQVINDMREDGGVISSGPMAGTRLLVLTTTGAKSGPRRRALLFFSKDGAECPIARTASASTRAPAWLHNLEADPTASVEVDGRQFEA